MFTERSIGVPAGTTFTGMPFPYKNIYRNVDPTRFRTTIPLPICYHIKFGHYASKGVCTNRREPPKLGSTGTPARLWWRRG